MSTTLYACSVGERAHEWSQVNTEFVVITCWKYVSGKAANSKENLTITDLAD